MKRLGLALVLATLAGWACQGMLAMAQSAPDAVALNLLLATPDRYLNRPLDILIVEPLEGPATAKALAAIEYGQVRIRVPDDGSQDVALVPAAFRMSDPNRYKAKFDRPLESPIKVRGELLADNEMETGTRRKHYVIRVASYEYLPPATPKPLKSIAELDAAAATWDRQRIVYEGTYETAFEVSALDKRIWLESSRTTEMVNAPSQRLGRHAVRVTGYIYTKRGGYGHLGGYAYELVADRIEFLR